MNERPGPRDSTARWQSYADWLESEAERLRAEWRKADDGWIACRDELRGAVEATRAEAVRDVVLMLRDSGIARETRVADHIERSFGAGGPLSREDRPPEA